MRLGIDFGTTRSVVAAVDGGRYPVVTFDTGTDYTDYVPGAAVIRGDRVLYGWSAIAESGEEPADAWVSSVKRAVAALAPDELIPGTRVTALELATGFLRHLRELLLSAGSLELSPDEPLEAMVAVPASASTRQRYLTLEAFRRAGFSPLGMLNEPTAAAVELAQRHLRNVGAASPKRYAVVYDLGGGTFDAAAVSLLGSHYELLASEGIATLGGDDIDELILELALSRAGVDRGTVGSSIRAALLLLCRSAKEGLSPSTRRLLIDLPQALAGTEEVVLDTAELYARSQPLIDRTVECLEAVLGRLADHGIDTDNPRELGAVYLVGGSVAFPPVGRTLRTLYKRKLKMAAQPHAATAVGLAVAADPDAGVFVRESATRYFGVWREGDSGRDKTFDLLISKDSAPEGDQPLVVRRIYRPAHRVGHLRYLECSRLDAGQPAGDLTPWSEIVFPYDPSLADRERLDELPAQRDQALGGEEIVETYRYAADGAVAVDIENRTHGYRRSYQLGGFR